MHSLAASALACERDDRVLFRDLAFAVNAGEVLFVEGRNGSGKTTLLHILAGMRRPDEGDVLWCGRAVGRFDSEFRAQVAFVGHTNGVKSDLSAQENLRVARALSVPGVLHPDAALERVGLAGFEDVETRRLSAGQRRRVALARLLVVAAPLWILDEPFSSLDRHGTALMEETVAWHVREGGLAVVTAHHEADFRGAAVRRVVLS
jgi:heme exporter protein A